MEVVLACVEWRSESSDTVARSSSSDGDGADLMM